MKNGQFIIAIIICTIFAILLWISPVSVLENNPDQLQVIVFLIVIEFILMAMMITYNTELGRFLTMVLFIVSGSGLIYLAVSQIDFATNKPKKNTTVIISHPEFPDEISDTSHFHFHNLEEVKAFSDNMENGNDKYMFTKEVSIYYNNRLISEFCK